MAESVSIHILHQERLGISVGENEFALIGLVYVAHLNDLTAHIGTLNAEQAAEFFSSRKERLAMFSSESKAIELILPQDVKAESFEYSDTARLALTEVQDFDNDLTRLVYIRPAVYTQN
jgi:hypothetical protein